MDHESEHHFEEKEQNWAQQQAMFQAILELGITEYARRLPDVHKEFEGDNHTLCYIDEGTPMGDMRVAGSGILAEGENRSSLISLLLQGGVKAVTSHTGCGAAALYRERNGITDKTVDEIAIEHAQQIAKELDVPYTGHITDLKRPPHFHSARIVYVDGTGTFNPCYVPGLPSGFVVSRRFMNPEHAWSEVTLAIKIAFGNHGFGNKFVSENPFLVIVIGDPTNEEFYSEKLQRELQDLKDQLKQTEPENLMRLRFDKWEKQMPVDCLYVDLDQQNEQVIEI